MIKLNVPMGVNLGLNDIIDKEDYMIFKCFQKVTNPSTNEVKFTTIDVFTYVNDYNTDTINEIINDFNESERTYVTLTGLNSVKGNKSEFNGKTTESLAINTQNIKLTQWDN